MLFTCRARRYTIGDQGRGLSGISRTLFVRIPAERGVLKAVLKGKGGELEETSLLLRSPSSHPFQEDGDSERIMRKLRGCDSV
jgi:hypothetical protein